MAFKYVYILTKEGRGYTTEGLEHLTKEIKNRFNCTDELLFHMGANFNNAEYLAERLENSLSSPDETTPIVVLSYDKGILYLHDEGINILIENLKENPTVSSWQYLYNETVKNNE